MAKLKGKAKSKFLARMKKGRLAKAAKRVTKRVRRRSKSTKSGKKRRKSQPIRTRKRRTKTVAKKRRFARARSGFNKITGNKFVRGAVLGLGGGALAIQVTERFAPQFSGIAGPIGAFVMGGPIGLVASLFLQGGLGGLFSGGQTAGNGGGQTV